MRKVLTFIIFVTAIVFSGELVDAREPRPLLHSGMTAHEVLKAWGSPDEKVERESRREDVWQYAEGALYFREGKLVKFPDDYGVSALVPNRTALKKEHRAALKAKSHNNEVGMEDVLSEVMQTMPADGDSHKPPRHGGYMPPGGPAMGRAIPGRPPDADDESD